MKLKIKKLKENIIPPSYAYEHDAALDLYSSQEIILKSGQCHQFKLGFATEIPQGYVALIWDKSSFGSQGIKTLGGVIDAGYRGEWKIVLQNLSDKDFKINKGQKIAQALIQKVEKVKIEETNKLSDSQRGKGGFGSSGK
ncbi:MAG: dUTP diphosphatase [Patescibacteria group bacterium]|nr:dUTP diphosphatase [Patescibacteria group bacterium]